MCENRHALNSRTHNGEKKKKNDKIVIQIVSPSSFPKAHFTELNFHTFTILPIPRRRSLLPSSAGSELNHYYFCTTGKSRNSAMIDETRLSQYIYIFSLLQLSSPLYPPGAPGGPLAKAGGCGRCEMKN